MGIRNVRRKTQDMKFKLLDNIEDIRDAFLNRFVMSWDEFQIKQKDWIAEMSKKNYPINIEWYKQSYMWDRMNPDFPRVSMKEALEFLREHRDSVFFMSEKSEDIYRGEKSIDFIAEADAQMLAAQIEHEWYNSYKLAEQNMYDADATLPDDLYVFDSSMKWCAVFTHETADWESEIDNPLKAAESRYCIICKI